MATKTAVRAPVFRRQSALQLPALQLIEQEARALLTRLERLKPFALQTPMVTAAAISPAAQTAIEIHLLTARRRLRKLVDGFLLWLRSPAGQRAAPATAQKRFTLVRLQFNALLSQLDIFADVIVQRSEHETGVWVAGLDDVATDALKLPGDFFKAPPVVCYLDRGHGAAIRRARTRLPGGDENPVAIIRVPRERMVGSGIASSLVHEVGHQAAALLDLVNSLKPGLQARQRGASKLAWKFWERWISEIVADFWSVAKVGIAAPQGLLAVVSLPRPFVFRLDAEDPHPMPWLRVKLSCAMGNALYPHPQWSRLSQMWESFYPLAGLDEQKRKTIRLMETTMPDFTGFLVNHRPRSLRGKSLKEALTDGERSPNRLTARFKIWRNRSAQMRAASPTLAFAVIGQARFDCRVSPEEESSVLSELLSRWALRGALDSSARCASKPSDLNRTA